MAIKKAEVWGHPEESSDQGPKKDEGIGHNHTHIKAGPTRGLAWRVATLVWHQSPKSLIMETTGWGHGLPLFAPDIEFPWLTAGEVDALAIRLMEQLQI